MKSISRRTALIGAGAIAAAYGGYRLIRPSAGARPRADMKLPAGRRPNILLVLTDQERARHLIPAEVDLPHHDRLMAGSTVFRNASTVSNLCSMARGIVYSGLHPQQNGLWENTPLPYSGGFRKDIPTLGTMMQDAGYTTGYFGKWHLSHFGVDEAVGHETIAETFGAFGFGHTDQDRERDGAHHGWKYDPLSAASTAQFIADQKGGDKPWFAAVNFVNPHDIMFFKTGEHQQQSRLNEFPDVILPAPDDPLYDKDWGIDLPETFGDVTLDGKPDAHREMQRVMALALGEIPLDNTDYWRAYNNYYFNCLADLDRNLGLVLDALDASGQADDTIVVFVSDHGEMAGVHGLREKGGNIYRENQNIPLFIRHPDVGGGREVQALASQLDIVPTLLSFAGIESNKRRDAYPLLAGHDLSPAMTASNTNVASGPRTGVLMQWTSLIHMSEKSVRNFAAVQKAAGPFAKMSAIDFSEFFGGFSNRGHMRGIADGRYKFARYFSPYEHHTPTTLADLTLLNDIELYDTLSDPLEKTNLANDLEVHQDIILALNSQMNALIADEVGVDDGSYLPGPASIWTA
ncbi:MAG: sulfatase-like hydrolase/transferase [Candidatus Phaeomarinobacter sp.]